MRGAWLLVKGGLTLGLLLLLPGLWAGNAHAVSYASAPTTFGWIDPSTHTNAVWSNPTQCTGGGDTIGDDSITALINIGFTFTYGGVAYTQLRIMTNGRLEFGNTWCGAGTLVIGPPRTYTFPYPDANLVNTMKVYGADIDVSPSGSGGGPGPTTCPPATCYVRYTATPLGTAPNRQFVVSWVNTPDWASTGSFFNLQVILNENGSFVYQYGASNNPDGGHADIGWELSTTDFATLTYTDIGALNGSAFLFTPQLHHFDIVAGASGIACGTTPEPITIIARDAANNVLTNYLGLINLSTSTNNGDWAIGTAGGTLTNGAPNSGAATYQFVAADGGMIVLNFTDVAQPVTITVQDSATGIQSTSATITFTSDGLNIINDPIQVAGRNQQMQVQRLKNCAVNPANGFNANKGLRVWLTLDPSQPAGATLPGIIAVNTVAALPTANPGGGGNVTFAFSGGIANFQLTTGDVGKYILNMQDPASTSRQGSSNPITTRPFGLAFPGIQHASTPTAAVLAKAGANFSATVTAYLWQAAADLNNDGIPDAGANITTGGVTPRYAWNTTISAIAPSQPSPGVLGNINNGSIPRVSFSGGSATVSNLQYTEAGNVTLQAQAVNYLNTPGVNVTGNSGMDGTGMNGYVGRFYPDHFAVSAATLTNRTDLACSPASVFTYMNERMDTAFTLTAQNVANATTQNYVGSFAKLSLASSASFGFGAIDTAGPTLLTARLDTSLPPSGTWTTGAASVTAPVAVTRLATPDGPYSAFNLGIAPNDPDGVQLLTSALNLDVDNNGINDHFKIGSSTMIRFGRLRLANASGSELLDLPISIQTQFWNGAGFVTNTNDNCTSISAANIKLQNYQPAGFSANVPQANVSTGGAFVSGVGSLKLTKPSPAAKGNVDLCVDLDVAPGSGDTTCQAVTPANKTYLQGAWTGTSYTQDPVSRDAFGIYKGATDIIYMRENY